MIRYVRLVSLFLTLTLAICSRADDLIDFLDSEQVANFEINVVRDPTKKEAVVFLLKDLKGIELLKERLYLRTNELNIRPLYSLPVNIPRIRPEFDSLLTFTPFYNQTTRGYFNEHSTNMSSYLAIQGQDFLVALENFFTELKAVVGGSLDPDKFLAILPLFETFTIQERRAGLMFTAMHQTPCWRVNAQTPFYYLERNFFVDCKNQKLLETAISEQFPTKVGTQEDQEQFQNEHLISDKIGFGDLHLMFDYTLIDRASVQMRLGVMTTIPSAFTFKRGLRGSHFRRTHNFLQLPLLDLEELFEKFTSPDEENAVEFCAAQFFNQALDQLSTMLIEEQLGNRRHFGIGVYYTNTWALSDLIRKWCWTDYFALTGFTSLEYLIPHNETRFFVQKDDRAEFDQRNFNSLDPALILSNYDFLQSKFTQRFFPYALRTRVYPGLMFQMQSELRFARGRYGFTVGLDTWVRTQEGFGSICTSEGMPSASQLDCCVARSPFAYQSKVFGTVFWIVDNPDAYWNISLYGDYTDDSVGIGRDFTLALRIEVNF